MKTSDNGIALLKKFEGVKLHAYKDAVGVWTIGYGHTSMAGDPTVTAGLTITQAEAEDILRSDLVKYEKPVNELVKVPLTQNQFDALVSFTYNLGAGNLKSSTLLRKLNAGDYEGAAAQFAVWDKASGRVLNGLVTRRAAEAALFRKADAKAPQAPVETPKPVPAPVTAPTPKVAPVSATASAWGRLFAAILALIKKVL